MVRRRWLALAGWLLSLAVVGGACFWAGHVVTRSPLPSQTLARESMDVAVTTDSVGRTLTYNVTVSQARVPVAANLLPGVVTSVSVQDSYSQGDTVYTVEAIPVRVVAGSTPFYRDLSFETRGEDVRQLSQALVDLGYLGWADEVFGPRTEQAVKAWQKDLGQEATGVVARGELIAVPSLPQALFLDSTVLRTGAVLTGEELLVSTASGEPVFSLDLSQDQAQAIPSDAVITIPYEGHTWQAVITASGFKQDEASGSNVYSLSLAGLDGGAVCASECAVLPATEQLYIPASIEIVPSVSGLAVPVTALSSHPDGSVSVELVEAGATHLQRVEVLASVDGIAVVTGVKEGDRVRVYGSGQAGSEQSGSSQEPARQAPGTPEPDSQEQGGASEGATHQEASQ